MAYVVKQDGPPRALRLREDRALWRDYAILFLPSRAGGSHQPARITEQAAFLCEFAGPSPPRIQCFALRTDNAKILEWRCESFPLCSGLLASSDRAVAVARSLERAETVGGLLRSSFKKLYPRQGEGNKQALEGQMREAIEVYWTALAEPFSRLTLVLNDSSANPEQAEGVWSSTVREVAIRAFESLADTFDSSADELRRVADARKSFYGGMKRKLQ